MLLLSASIAAKFGLVFVLTLENALSWGFYFQVTRMNIVLLKNDTWHFQNSPPFERSACVYVTIKGNFEHFQFFNFETDFPENENLFQTTGVPFFFS